VSHSDLSLPAHMTMPTRTSHKPEMPYEATTYPYLPADKSNGHKSAMKSTCNAYINGRQWQMPQAVVCTTKHRSIMQSHTMQCQCHAVHAEGGTGCIAVLQSESLLLCVSHHILFTVQRHAMQACKDLSAVLTLSSISMSMRLTRSLCHHVWLSSTAIP